MKQKQQRNNAESSIEEEVAEELDAVEAFVTCHTSSKKGLSEEAREAVVSPDLCWKILLSVFVT
jgi:hypothetical protein